ncbi:BQ5605_C044g12162 [Microbotryum silenes-dioicae]|uniref:BQ5605_C044g12162 protein n=1 Tax=Microbotryum silenes-dioicae TaxID=796604 RepID=A0A2X0MTK0_9BASI|nr:BQ5605_C044g12162 [Microbotryum silenes-dioicae]
MAVCAHCKARHWECKGRTGHFSMCCLQGKVQLSPLSGPIPSINSYLNPRIANARSYSNTRPGTQGPRMFCFFGCFYPRLAALIPTVNQRPALAQIWLIDPAEATATRLGLDGADSRIQRSTLNKLESMLRTKNHFTDAPTTFLRRARKWRCLSAIPTPTREIVDVKTLFSRCTVIDVPRVGPLGKYQVVSSLHPSAMPLRYPLLFPAGEDGFHPNIPLCGFHQARPPIARN